VGREIKSLSLLKARDLLGALGCSGADDVSSFRRCVEIGGKESGLNELLLRPARDRQKLPRLAIAGGDRSGLVEN
jgi:hypothetical protein